MHQHDPGPETPRRAWPVRVYRLGDEPGDDLSAVSTPEERLAMVAELSRRMWELTGRPVPSYSRAAMPGRVLRPA
ncbi:MAG: hypothetical protein ACR2MC_00505 [Actinomycetota bacterium]